MNPMNRRMFRDPMASRQASGILASSPQLANVVQQRQPIRMQAGGSQEIAVLAQAAGQGDMSAVARLQSIASSNTTPAALRSAAAEVLNLPSISRIANQKQNARDFFSSIRKGPESQVDVGIAGIDNGAPFITAGVNPNALSNILTDATGDRFLSPNARTDMSADATAADTDPFSKRFMQNLEGRGQLRFGRPDPVAEGAAIEQSPAGEGIRSFMESIGIPRVNMAANAAARQAAAEGRTPGGISTLGGAADFILFGDEERKTPPQRAASAARDVVAPIVETIASAPSAIGSAIGSGIDYLTTPTATDAGLSAAQAAAGAKRDESTFRRPEGTTPVTPVAAPAKEDKAPAKEDKTPNPVAAAEKIASDPASLLPQISEALDDNKKTPKQKADAVDEILNIKGTRKERTEQHYEMLKELLGEDRAKDIRTDAGYNLMMTGLMIAAGQSPDALTNIAGGLAKGLADYGGTVGEAAQEARKEEQAIKLLAAKEVGEEITAEEAARIRTQELAEERQFRSDLASDKADLQRELAELPGPTQRLLQEVADRSGRSLADVYLLSKAGTTTDTQRLASDYLKQYGPRGLTAEESGILATVKLSDYGSPEEAIKELFGKDLSAGTQTQTTSGGFKLK